MEVYAPGLAIGGAGPVAWATPGPHASRIGRSRVITTGTEPQVSPQTPRSHDGWRGPDTEEATAEAAMPSRRPAGVLLSCASLADLGPRWVRVATVPYGQQRSPTVVNGPEEPQIIDPAARVAGVMGAGDSDCGPEGRGFKSRRSPQISPGFTSGFAVASSQVW